MTTLFFAFLLDLAFGDPIYSFHPVRLMGKGIDSLEVILRKHVKNTRFAGFLLAVLFPLSIFLLVSFILVLCFKIHPFLAWFVNVLGIYTTVSVQDLKKEAMLVQKKIEASNLPEARTQLARIVGRETKDLEESEIIRATVETVAESLVDGVIAPLFFAAIGGAPLALAYKAINTLDSMVGHLNERYHEFGFFSAKIDDVVNWIPARLSCFFISLGAFFRKQNASEAFSGGFQQSKIVRNISSIPEASFAGALEVRLGGVNQYGKRTERKPLLGRGSKPLVMLTIQESLYLLITSAWVTLFFCLVLNFIIM